MSTSTGRSGGSQPGRRGRRRRRRGAGTSAGKDQNANPANSANPVSPVNKADQPQTGGGDRSGNPPAGSTGKTGGRSRRRSSGKGGARAEGGKTGKTGGGGKAGGAGKAGKAGKAGGGKTGGKSGGKFTKPGGRRLRTVDETSAGGLVVDASRASAALIGRLDRRGRLLWSLPKGHIESGETPEQAAIREVAEETGIAGRVLAPLGTIDYWFVAEDRRVHKTVHHFLMEAIGGELSDEDVEVTEVAWVPLGELDGRLAYADERRLVRLATALLSESA